MGIDDYDGLTLLEPGKTVDFVTDYQNDNDYFKVEKESGTYALTVTVDEGMPKDFYPSFYLTNKDKPSSTWYSCSYSGISYASEDNRSYTFFFNVKQGHQLQGRIEYYNYVANSQSSFLPKGMKGTIRIDKVPADMYNLLTPIKKTMDIGETLKVDGQWNIQDSLQHIPFEKNLFLSIFK